MLMDTEEGKFHGCLADQSSSLKKVKGPPCPLPLTSAFRQTQAFSSFLFGVCFGVFWKSDLFPNPAHRAELWGRGRSCSFISIQDFGCKSLGCQADLKGWPDPLQTPELQPTGGSAAAQYSATPSDRAAAGQAGSVLNLPASQLPAFSILQLGHLPNQVEMRAAHIPGSPG